MNSCFNFLIDLKRLCQLQKKKKKKVSYLKAAAIETALFQHFQKVISVSLMVNFGERMRAKKEACTHTKGILHVYIIRWKENREME